MQPEQPTDAMIAAARAYAESTWTYDPADYISAEHRDNHINADARGTAHQPWFVALWQAGIAEGLRQATEGWEREWGARDADGYVFAVEDGEGEERAQSLATWPKDRPGTVVSRLVGPWEPAEQPEPAHESFTKLPCPHVEGPHPKHTWSHKDKPCEGHVCPGAPVEWPAEQPEGSDR